MAKVKQHNQLLGKWGEACAARYLEQTGYSIIARNIRTPFGEIDLLAQHDGDGNIVFVEVKTRASSSFGPPEISVDRRKKEHLIASISFYLQEHPEMEESWRFDVIAVERLNDREPVRITHFENALQV